MTYPLSELEGMTAFSSVKVEADSIRTTLTLS